MIIARQRTAEDEPRARMLGGYKEPIGKQLGWGGGKAGQLALPVDKLVHGGAHTALREVVPQTPRPTAPPASTARTGSARSDGGIARSRTATAVPRCAAHLS